MEQNPKSRSASPIHRPPMQLPTRKVLPRRFLRQLRPLSLSHHHFLLCLFPCRRLPRLEGWSRPWSSGRRPVAGGDTLALGRKQEGRRPW
ncbi:hypothetical protein BRADI_3g46728v3 [Brachypodium distachyon]|uniref:Uncharacterized protein n=1 Tax=Brachypodium distachyon TaxID=15368 RepID=A0A2K2D3P0_BRADI|nr:hypothetical protein BRADI_3g46728v3 [Brachypodium distachyon]